MPIPDHLRPFKKLLSKYRHGRRFSLSRMAEPNLHPPDFSTCLDQVQSPLFSTLPPEIRGEIFAFALSDFEDTDKPYGTDTFWTRPGYNAPRCACTNLLQSCKRVYAEAWYMPFALSEHTFYLSSADRAPEDRFTEEKFQECLDIIHKFHGKVEAGHLRVFPQLFKLEAVQPLQDLLNTRHFYPTNITITIRYTDFWFWENDEPLRIDARWVNEIKLPDSVARFSMDFESLKRRKGEIEYISNEAADNWYFRRTDGVTLTARKSETSVSEWTGSSTLGDTRWVRDEDQPGQLDYHIVTVTWKPSREPSRPDLPGRCPSLKLPPGFERPRPPGIGVLHGSDESDSDDDDVVCYYTGEFD